jgi:hypothetical protein
MRCAAQVSIDGPGQVSRAGLVISSTLPTLHSRIGPERFLVALTSFGDLLICAKNLFVKAKQGAAVAGCHTSTTAGYNEVGEWG